MINTLTLDLETTGLDRYHDTIILIGYRYDETGEVKFVEYANGQLPEPDFLEALKDPRVTKRGHNIKFDVLFLMANGFEVNGPLDCTSVLCYLENPFRSTSLKELVQEKLNKPVTKIEDLLEKARATLKLPKNRKVPFTAVHIDDWKPYNAADVTNCDELRANVTPTEWYKEIEQPLIKALVKIEQRGIQLDINYLQDVKLEYEQQLNNLEVILGEVNPRSPKQVTEKLKEITGRDLESTDKLTLKRLAWSGESYVKVLLEHREISKLQSTYVTPLIERADKTGRIHGSFNQSGTEKGSGGTKTGRLTSSDPNLQNIPGRTFEGKRIRKAFVPSKDFVMIDSDLSQIEPRLVAHFSQSSKLLKAFASGVDTHSLFASDIFKRPLLEYNKEALLTDPNLKLERFIGKTSWLATVYGCWYKKLLVIAQTNSEDPIPYDEDFFELVQQNFWSANPEIQSWRNQEIAQARTLGYIVTIGGRIIRIPNLRSKNYQLRSEAERQVINYKIQGSAADIMKMILVRLDRVYAGSERYLLACVHDEVLCEVHKSFDIDEELDLISWVMTDTVQLNNVLIEADTRVVSNWSEK